jgi:hypothetical protein
MIYKKDLKAYGVECIEQYYEIIIQSKINGQYKQLEQQIKSLSKDQKKDFLDYITNYELEESDTIKYLESKIIELI